MTRYLIRRTLQVLFTTLGVATFVFFVSRLSGDPVALILPPDATAVEAEAVRESLGLNDSIFVQFGRFLGSLAVGDFGDSIRQDGKALDIVLNRLPATLKLAGISFVIGQALAFAFGIGSQLLRRQGARNTLLWVALIRQAIPVFWFGLLLIIVFGVNLRLFPVIGMGTWRHYVLPSVTLATLQLALFLRLFNASFGEAREQDYVRTAVSKGVRQRLVVTRHMLPNALLPIVTVAGVNFGVLLTGTVVTETVFSWPGIGRLIVQAVFQRDYPVVQAGIVVIALIFMLVNFVVDLLYAAIDPRIRLE